MKIMLVSDGGQVLDIAEISREEWDNLSPAGAMALLGDLMPGDER